MSKQPATGTLPACLPGGERSLNASAPAPAAADTRVRNKMWDQQAADNGVSSDVSRGAFRAAAVHVPNLSTGPASVRASADSTLSTLIEFDAMIRPVDIIPTRVSRGVTLGP